MRKGQSDLSLVEEVVRRGNMRESCHLKKGPWTSAEDAILVDYVKKHGEGNWNAVQKHSGLSRCGKSCRLRWANHLRPDLKKGMFTPEEERRIVELHAKLGNKWARMAAEVAFALINKHMQSLMLMFISRDDDDSSFLMKCSN
ncbi:hypothetical protein Goari_025710 [Gossypium aridum]|uniref:Uncharacterized protein n=1 Tax=Gossypium aridum TaxID=34290 RepID=A0A7J8XA23_GOSAI|nr:hypothetical protein [Gossypium aridum]